MRKTRQLLSQFCLERNIKDHFVYWAPELLVDQGITKASDVWSLGIVIFMLSTGQSPYQLGKKDSIFNAIVGGAIKWDLLDGQPKIRGLLKQMLAVDPKKRCNSEQVLLYFQNEMVVFLQRFCRAVHSRIMNKDRFRSMITMQKYVRGMMARISYKRMIQTRRDVAATKIQKLFRNYKNAKRYRHMRKKVTFLQANVLARQTRRAYLKLKQDVVQVQSFVRRMLGYTSYNCVRLQRMGMVKDITGIGGLNDKFFDLNKMASLYFQNFKDFNGFGGEQQKEEEDKQENGDAVKKAFNRYGEGNMKILTVEDAKLQKALGPKYEEFEPQLEDIKNKLRQANKLFTISAELPITLATKREADLWEKANEPLNVDSHHTENGERLQERQLDLQDAHPRLRDLSVRRRSVSCGRSDHQNRQAEAGRDQAEHFE
jgi:hypothetical protein